jgi:hypothetical protein
MKHIKARVKDAGAWTDVHSVENVDAMYQVVAIIFGPKGASHNARRTASSMEYISQPSQKEAADGKGRSGSTSSTSTRSKRRKKRHKKRKDGMSEMRRKNLNK